MFTEIINITEIWDILEEKYKDKVAVIREDSEYEYSYKELNKRRKILSGYLRLKGVTKGEKIALFSSNHPRWFVCDSAIMSAGAICVPRDIDTSVIELAEIYKHSDSCILITDNIKIIEHFMSLEIKKDIRFIIYTGETSLKLNNSDIEIINYEEIMENNSISYNEKIFFSENDIAAIFYTTGTTGTPKGVMMSHGALLKRFLSYDKHMDYDFNGICVATLPLSHVAPRLNDFSLLARGNTIHYTNYLHFLNDVKKYNPEYICVVPKLVEEIYHEILKGKSILNIFVFITFPMLKILNDKFKICVFNKIYKNLLENKISRIINKNTVISIFGAALDINIEKFFHYADIKIIGMYGLTEGANIAFSNLKNKKIGYVGKVYENVLIKIINTETDEELPFGKKGQIVIKSSESMNGYYKDEDATKNIFTSDNYIKTGDLGILKKNNYLEFKGRMKDIIILSNGKNIDIIPIENNILKSKYIDQVVVTGQDKPYLSALVVPNISEICAWAAANNVLTEKLYNDKRLLKEILLDVNNQIETNINTKLIHYIKKIKLIRTPFSTENGLLSLKQKPIRYKIYEKFEKEIEEIYNNK